jgi:hypothetical protein
MIASLRQRVRVAARKGGGVAERPAYRAFRLNRPTVGCVYWVFSLTSRVSDPAAWETSS